MYSRKIKLFALGFRQLYVIARCSIQFVFTVSNSVKDKKELTASDIAEGKEEKRIRRGIR